jgi:hypothetical protein
MSTGLGPLPAWSQAQPHPRFEAFSCIDLLSASRSRRPAVAHRNVSTVLLDFRRKAIDGRIVVNCRRAAAIVLAHARRL